MTTSTEDPHDAFGGYDIHPTVVVLTECSELWKHEALPNMSGLLIVNLAEEENLS